MTADMQDIHDAFRILLASTPAFAHDDILRTNTLRFASIMADMLGRIEVLESRSETDLKTILEEADTLHTSNQTPYQFQLDNLATALRAEEDRLTRHVAYQDSLELPTLIARFHDLKGRVDVECERSAQHAADQADLELDTWRQDINNLAVLARTERERLDNHDQHHVALELEHVPARLAGLDDKCASLAPLLTLLPLPTPPDNINFAKGDGES